MCRLFIGQIFCKEKSHLPLPFTLHLKIPTPGRAVNITRLHTPPRDIFSTFDMRNFIHSEAATDVAIEGEGK